MRTKHSITAALMSLILAVGLFAVPAIADAAQDATYTLSATASAPKTGVDDYPAYLKAKPKDALIDPWRFYNRECTSFVAWRLNNNNGVDFWCFYKGKHWGDAYKWGTVARSLGITVDNIPRRGSVAWWSSGHVAWVESVSGSNVTIEEYNYDYNGNYHRRTIPKSKITGFIHIKDLPVGPPKWERIWGATVADTMGKIAQKFGKPKSAVIATSNSFKDALAASSLAGKHNAVVLMTKRDSLTAQTKSELARMGVQTVYLVGSKANVTASVERQIANCGDVRTVTRIAATTPGQRAVAVAKATGGVSNTVIIVTQNNYRDALSIAPYAYATKSPILYAEANKKLSSATLAYLKGAGYKKAIIVGGPLALPATIDEQLVNAGFAKTGITRLAGSNAYTTSLQIAQWMTGALKNGNYGTYKGKTLAYVKFQSSARLYVDRLAITTGQNWPDALSGAALCGKNRAVMLLADAKDGAHYAEAVAFCKANKADMAAAYVLGGEKAVQPAVWNVLRASTK